MFKRGVLASWRYSTCTPAPPVHSLYLLLGAAVLHCDCCWLLVVVCGALFSVFLKVCRITLVYLLFDFPQFQVSKMPRAWLRRFDANPTPLVVGGVLFACGLSALQIFSSQRALPVYSMSKEHIQANEEYMKFHNMNPIFGNSDLACFVSPLRLITTCLQESAARSEAARLDLRLSACLADDF